MSIVARKVTTLTVDGLTEVTFNRVYPYFEAANTGEEAVYISRFRNCTAGADGVYTVPSGGVKVARLDAATIYINGSGTVQITAKDEPDISSSASAVGSGGSGGKVLPKSAIDDLF